MLDKIKKNLVYEQTLPEEVHYIASAVYAYNPCQARQNPDTNLSTSRHLTANGLDIKIDYSSGRHDIVGVRVADTEHDDGSIDTFYVNFSPDKQAIVTQIGRGGDLLKPVTDQSQAEMMLRLTSLALDSIILDRVKNKLKSWLSAAYWAGFRDAFCRPALALARH